MSCSYESLLSFISLISSNHVALFLKADCFVEGEPGDVFRLELVNYKGLRAIVVSLILGVQVNNEEHVLPKVVLLLNMLHIPYL